MLNKNNTYVFSEVNEKSVAIAKQLIKTGKTQIYFANSTEDTHIEIEATKIPQSITELTFGKKNKVSIYLISNNEESNLKDALELIEKYKQRDNTNVYVASDSEETELILDSTYKGKMIVELINEKQKAILNLLNNKPLYLNSANNIISVLIVGCGNVGKEFLKSAICCGMMIEHRLKVTIIDLKADIIKEQINTEAPELMTNYDIKFVKADIKSQEAMEAIKIERDINYVLVSTEKDKKNLEIATFLRGLFIKLFNKKPIINIWIENECINEQINKLENKILIDKNISYEINAFGKLSEIYLDWVASESDLERMSKAVHLAYDPTDTKFLRYNKFNYNKNYLRAIAIHIKYKLYALLRNKYSSDDMSQNLDLLKRINSTELETLLAKNEHDRWNAYMRVNGYVFASKSDVKKYYSEIGDYANHIAKYHPALVKYSELDKVSEDLSKITSEQIDLKIRDHELIRKMPEILENYIKS